MPSSCRIVSLHLTEIIYPFTMSLAAGSDSPAAGRDADAAEIKRNGADALCAACRSDGEGRRAGAGVRGWDAVGHEGQNGSLSPEDGDQSPAQTHPDRLPVARNG